MIMHTFQIFFWPKRNDFASTGISKSFEWTITFIYIKILQDKTRLGEAENIQHIIIDANLLHHPLLTEVAHSLSSLSAS